MNYVRLKFSPLYSRLPHLYLHASAGIETKATWQSPVLAK
jgi:hypothetical protein